MIAGEMVAARARALVGTPFRAQGRDPATGIDCIGLVLHVFEIPVGVVRRNYRLSGGDRAELETQLSRWFRKLGKAKSGAGDVLLCSVSPRQMHLAIQCGESFVHADARLRRIIEMPGAPPWPIIGAFRRRKSKRG